MGEYAEMMLDGTCCCNCGEYLGDGDGFATYCASCKPAQEKVLLPAKQKAPKPKKTVTCTNFDCGRRFVDENAMRNHLRTFHIDKVAMREKQEKDKKLNAIRNAAPALLEALEKAREDINWMLNSKQFLNSDVFNYIDTAIAAARGE